MKIFYVTPTLLLLMLLRCCNLIQNLFFPNHFEDDFVSSVAFGLQPEQSVQLLVQQAGQRLAAIVEDDFVSSTAFGLQPEQSVQSLVQQAGQRPAIVSTGTATNDNNTNRLARTTVTLKIRFIKSS